MKPTKLLNTLAVGAALLAGPLRADVVNVTSDLLPDTTTTWYATNEYVLQSVIYVRTNATLVIEPGTVVKGSTNTTTLFGRDGIPNLVSALWVARGGKLYATGTVEKPIIFTMEGDDVNDPDDVPPTVTGKWGGIVLMGNATINSAFYNAGNVANPVFDVYEGVLTSPAPQPEHMFGGTDDEDSSGILRYVSIRHTGNQFAPDKELNSLTMAGVGRGTLIEYVESYASSDDAFEWFGGSVNTKYLVAAFCEDDDFDTDQGYHGTNQFWFGIKPTWNGSSDSRGMETDGDTSQTILGDRQPFSRWAVFNATLVGRGQTNLLFGGGSGWNARDEAAPNLINSVVTHFNKGILLDNDGQYHWTNTTVLASARNNVWDVLTNSANGNGTFLFTEVGFSNTVGSAGLGAISYTNDVALLDPRPQTGSPALGGALVGAPVPVGYRGAFFGAADAWADDWTALSSLGYLKPAAQPPSGANIVNVTEDIESGTTATWYATNEYVLQTIVYVKTNASLVIEPGTVIKGGTNASVLTSRPGIPNLVSALWVARGGKLYATGTVEKPIIFTMEGDDVNDPDDVPPTVTGKWGGIVLMGNATINSAFYNAGNVANPVFDVYEGVLTSPAPQPEHMFGGTDDEDSSGILRYVSIRHTGNQFAPDKELNSLTMAGVGRGTLIEYVESYASSDDAFEWFGGSVNTKYLVAAFCEDDDFDTDQGYHGTNQFWFGIKPTWNGSSDSRGMETDGDTSQTILGDRQPFSRWAVFNATLVGRGQTNLLFGGGSGWNARDEAAPNLINSVVTHFNKGILLDNDGQYHWTNTTVLASARNNVWDVLTNSANGNGTFLFTEVGFSNTVGSAGLGAISYTNDVALLDPRPQTGSVALMGALTGAPVATSYRGAFSGSGDAWADQWTALSSLGYLKPAAVIVAPPSLGIAINGGNVVVSFATQTGVSYQLQSKQTIDAVWANQGAAVTGTGATVEVTTPFNPAINLFLQVVAQ